MIYNLHQYFRYPQKNVHIIKKKNGNKNNKKHFHYNLRRCRSVKTQKACEQGWKANIRPKIKRTTSI